MTKKIFSYIMKSSLQIYIVEFYDKLKLHYLLKFTDCVNEWLKDNQIYRDAALLKKTKTKKKNPPKKPPKKTKKNGLRATTNLERDFSNK